jgi:hypothetical protein
MLLQIENRVSLGLISTTCRKSPSGKRLFPAPLIKHMRVISGLQSRIRECRPLSVANIRARVHSLSRNACSSLAAYGSARPAALRSCYYAGRRFETLAADSDDVAQAIATIHATERHRENALLLQGSRRRVAFVPSWEPGYLLERSTLF